MYSISVVIPTYNRAEYIGKAVKSVIGQNGQGIDYEIKEIIVVDDGSTDNTEEVIRSIGDERIVYHRCETNGGANKARNIGIELASSEWIAFQDSDDEWLPDKLRVQIEYLKSHPDCMMVSHPIRAVFPEGKETVTDVFTDDTDLIKELATHNFVGTPTMIVERERILEIGGFDLRLKALEDWDLAIRFADRYGIGMVPDVLMIADMTVEGMSADASKYYDSRCRIIASLRDIFMRHDCFEAAVENLLNHARDNGVLEQVGRILEMYLTQS